MAELPGDTQVFADLPTLADAVAEQLVSALAAAQAERGAASVVLTGGGAGIAVLSAVVARSDLDSVDWAAVDIWWGDERFVPADSEDRNEGQARSALLDRLALDPARVHPIGASDGLDAEPEQAAARYAEQLQAAAGEGAVPAFDILLLGVGPEGHCASIFPESPAAHACEAVVAVRDCPKPPPTRVSLTFPAIQSARQVWLLAAGESKADAVAMAAADAGPLQLPIAGARGTEATRWFLDREAAARL